MAKKSRRARSGASPIRSAQPSVVQPVRVARPPAAEAVRQVDFRKEYHYVIEDLKRIAILAGVLLVVLVVLALVLA